MTANRGPAFGAGSKPRKTPVKNDPVFGDQVKTITDFEDTIDIIKIGLSLTSISDLTISRSGSDALISFGTATVLLADFNYLDLTSDDFKFS